MEIIDLMNALGWTIINSFWQALIILILLVLLLTLLSPKLSYIRSMIAYFALIAVFAVSFRTFHDIYSLIRSEKDISNYHSNEGPSNFAVIYENSRLSEKAEIRSLFPFEEALDDAEAFISYNLLNFKTLHFR